MHPASRVNPYTAWIHEYPRVLLVQPTPQALQERLADAPGGEGQLVADLGSGSGNFLLELAARHPEWRFVGFELRYKRLVKAARKLEGAGLGNVWLLREAAERFHFYFPPTSLAEVHLNFPDPWPKRAQWKHRLVAPDFLARLERCLREGGRFYLKTDHSGYFLHVLSLLPGSPGLRIWAFSNDYQASRYSAGAARSEFEQMFRVRRKPIFYLVLEKQAPTG